MQHCLQQLNSRRDNYSNCIILSLAPRFKYGQAGHATELAHINLLPPTCPGYVELGQGLVDLASRLRKSGGACRH